MLKKNNFHNLKTLFDIAHVPNCLNAQGRLDETSMSSNEMIVCSYRKKFFNFFLYEAGIIKTFILK